MSVDQVARIDVKMSIGQAAETVQVSASGSSDADRERYGRHGDRQPEGRRAAAERPLVRAAGLLTPGVNPGTPGSITVRRLRGAVGQSVGMSANGARDTQNRFYYDGIEAMDLDSYSFSFSPSVDAIQEFRVQTSTYSAEVGGAPGGQVNLTTKSGTNPLHGRALGVQSQRRLHRAERVSSRASPDVKPPRLNRNQFGANIGGPV